MAATDKAGAPGGGPPIEAWVEKMRAFFSAAGEPLPEQIASNHPLLFVHKDSPPDEVSRRVVEILQGRHLLFRRSREIGTVGEDGEWEAMTPDRFRTWLPAVGGAVPFRDSGKDDKPRKCGLPYEMARAVLASDELRLKTPDIEAVNMVRLPVFRDALDERGDDRRQGFRKMELLPLGYDPESKTFTVRQVADYDETLDPGEGYKWLYNLLKYFAFSDHDRLAVQIAAQMSVFARGLYHGRAPMFLWNSNLPSSGKSRLSQLVLDPVFGDSGKSGYSYDSREEVRKELDGAAQEFARYIWFDDVPKGTIRNTDLNRWLTAKSWRCRIMGTKNIWKGPLFATTLMTGAQLELDNMIARRTLMIDLFPRQRARNRFLPEDAIHLDDEFFEDPVRRGQVLAALWSLLRHWDDLGRPGMTACPALAGERPLESFESWSAVIPCIVAAANLGNCLAAFVAPDAGDTETKEFEQLAEILIRAHALDRDSASVTMQEVVAAARLNGLFVEHLGSLEDTIRDLDQAKTWKWDLPSPPAEWFENDPRYVATCLEAKRQQAAGWTDKRLQSSWGKRFRKSAVAGQYYSVDDQVFEFGTRETSKKATFPIRRVTDGLPAAE